VAGNISKRLERVAQFNFPAEWLSSPETDNDGADLPTALAVSGGQTLAGEDIVSNIDTTAPTIVSLPADKATQVHIDSSILLKFSEAVTPASLKVAFRLFKGAVSVGAGGAGALTNFGKTFVFTPPQSLEFNTTYDIVVSTSLLDLSDVPLAHEFRAS